MWTRKEISPWDLEGVSSLLDKSLLRQEEGAWGEPRFVMLETIREYAPSGSRRAEKQRNLGGCTQSTSGR